MRVLITGGAGFIGSHFVRYWLDKYPDNEIVVLDKLTYAGHMENLNEVLGRIEFIHGDICLKEDVEESMKDCNLVFNFAAESHVDRSILGAGEFVHTNVWGTHVLLEAARDLNVDRFIQISTDEVYGSRLDGSFSECDRLDPSSPYSASKAGAELLAVSYFKTYGLPVLITRSSNNFGPRQYPEKLIPRFVLNALEDKPLPLYGDGRNIRDWIYVEDNCSAIDMVADKGVPGEAYNISSKNEKENIEIASIILKILGKRKDQIEFVKDRPGHDKRYSIDASKIKNMGWSQGTSFKTAIAQTINWYRENEWWWMPLRERV